MELKPDYEKSIVNLTNTFLKHFNCTTYHSEFPLEGTFEGFLHDTRKIVIFIIDGMGYKKFLSLNSRLGFENVLKISSVFPTTTVAAITSWFTARTPREHGLLGYILYLREVGSIVNMIEHTYPGIEGNIFSSILRKRLHRLENVFDLLKERELYGGVLTHSTIANSGLSYLIHRNGHIMSYMYMGDLFSTIKKRLLEDWNGILYVYWGHLDGLGHKKGPDSEAYEMEMERLLLELKKFTHIYLPKDTLFVITSDHGMIQVPNSNNVFLKPTDNFNKFLNSPPGGEMRMMYFYLSKKSNLEFLKAYFEENYRGMAEFINTKDAVENLLFGNGRSHPELYNRVGDAIMIAKGNAAFTYMYSGGEEKLLGMHGGLTEEELFVPAIFIKNS